MSDTNLQIITASYEILAVVDEITPPSIEQGNTGLEVMNDMLANMDYDGIRLGWFPQTSLLAIAPLQDQDIGPVKFLLAIDLALRYGITPPPEVVQKADAVYKALAKRYVKYVECDITGLPFSQGGLFGPGRI